jgi:hypothetical protein
MLDSQALINDVATSLDIHDAFVNRSPDGLTARLHGLRELVESARQPAGAPRNTRS